MLETFHRILVDDGVVFELLCIKFQHSNQFVLRMNLFKITIRKKRKSSVLMVLITTVLKNARASIDLFFRLALKAFNSMSMVAPLVASIRHTLQLLLESRSAMVCHGQQRLQNFACFLKYSAGSLMRRATCISAKVKIKKLLQISYSSM